LKAREISITFRIDEVKFKATRIDVTYSCLQQDYQDIKQSPIQSFLLPVDRSQDWSIDSRNDILSVLLTPRTLYGKMQTLMTVI
jgi:hypothetical protein